ncbi:hypothetical protein PITCH_A1500011 [uncultured Desulfobacterium sp.]|uniref:Flagellar hook-length control protein-like C-terminal domain-containing protein n=1 Tax=uncultured Desulfobacterium sp. TaxID=201089 RepID=A0A445MT84_9BACT|nr:hypothetical protein PITCH_A1500011 [uncultured Desulfobacterium sp.]
MEAGLPRKIELPEICLLEFSEKMNSNIKTNETAGLRNEDNQFQLTLINVSQCLRPNEIKTIAFENENNANQICQKGPSGVKLLNKKLVAGSDGVGVQVVSLMGLVGDNGFSMAGMGKFKSNEGDENIEISEQLSMLDLGALKMLIITHGNTIINENLSDGLSTQEATLCGKDGGDWSENKVLDDTSIGFKSDMAGKKDITENIMSVLSDNEARGNRKTIDCDPVCIMANNEDAVEISNKIPNIEINLVSNLHDKNKMNQVEDNNNDILHKVRAEYNDNKINKNIEDVSDATYLNENMSTKKALQKDVNITGHLREQVIIGDQGKRISEVAAGESNYEDFDCEGTTENSCPEGTGVSNGKIKDCDNPTSVLGKPLISEVINENSTNKLIRLKIQQGPLADKETVNFQKSETDQLSGNGDNENHKNNHQEMANKNLKEFDLKEQIRVSKRVRLGAEDIITSTSNNKIVINDEINSNKDVETVSEKNNECQFIGSRQSEIKSLDASNQTRFVQTNERTMQSNILSQIISRASSGLRNGLTSIEIRLKPESLGTLRMNISAENNQVSIKIVTEGQLVKEIIESNINLLKSEIQSHGLEVSKVEIVTDHDSGNNQSSHGKMKFSQFIAGKENIQQQGGNESEDSNPDERDIDGGINFFA